MIRKMGDFEVVQRTKDGMFNATGLLKQWNNILNNPKRDLDNFWRVTNISEFMSEIAKNEHGFNSVDFTDLKKVLSCAAEAKMEAHGCTQYFISNLQCGSILDLNIMSSNLFMINSFNSGIWREIIINCSVKPYILLLRAAILLRLPAG